LAELGAGALEAKLLADAVNEGAMVVVVFRVDQLAQGAPESV